MITKESKNILEFLLALCDIGEKFPGFETDIHGTTRENGDYYVRIIK